MSTQGPLTDAEDTWVGSAHPAKPHGSEYWVKVGGATRGVLVTVPIQSILGRTVTTAPLTFRVGPGHVAQTYTVARATADWSDGDATWNDKPTVSGTTVTQNVAAPLADGTSVTIETAPLLQEIADGRTWFGFWITSNAGSEQLLYSDDSGQPAWELTIELSDAPEQPEGLFPDVGAVGASKIVLGWRAADLDGVTGQADYRIQFSATDNFAAPDNDTGWLAGALPRHNMAAYAYALTAGVSTGWRVQVRDADGHESTWSDPAHVTYNNALGALVLDSPASTTFGDPSPRIQAHLTGGESITKWRIRVAKQNDRTDVVYDSRLQPGDSSGLLDFELPFRDPKRRRRVLPDDQPRWLHVRAWPSTKRAVGEGRPDYLETWVLITVDDDLGVEAPAGLTVTPVGDGDPRYVWEWSRSEAADAWLIMAGSEVLERLDASDVTESSGSYTWSDDGVLAPWLVNHCQVRAVQDDARSAASNVVNVTPKVEGRWVITTDPDIGAIRLSEGGNDSLQSVDTTSVAQKLNGEEYAVTYGPPRIGGGFAGMVYAAEDYRRLEALRRRPDLRPRFIWGTRSVRGRLSNLSPMPDPEKFFENQLAHAVTLGISQVEVED